jgi:hypothetical protein
MGYTAGKGIFTKLRKLLVIRNAKIPGSRNRGFNNQNTLKTILSRQNKQKPNRKIPAPAKIS